MKRLTRNVATIIFLAPLLVFAAGESKPDPTLGTRLTDCSAFFGLPSQTKTEFAGGLKGFALAATSYATVAFPDQRKFETEIGKSMVDLTDEIPKLQQDQVAFKNKFETCLSVLKTAEIELPPGMDETMKTLVPEMFSGNQW